MTEPTASPSLEALKDRILTEALGWYMKAGDYKEALRPYIDPMKEDGADLGIIQMHLEAIQRASERISKRSL